MICFSDVDGDDVIFSALSGNGTNFFDVSSDTGDVSVRQSLSSRRDLTYVVRVRATDDGLPARSSERTIAMRVIAANSYEPEITTPATPNLRVREDASVGDVIATIAARDQDPTGVNGQVRFLISGGDHEEAFAIGYVSGDVTVATPLDFERKSRYTIHVTATDLAPQPLQTTRAFVIDVDDVNDALPVFDPALIQAEVEENAEVGTTVTRLAAFDADSEPNAVISYSIVANTLPSNAFRVSPNDNYVITNALIDFEAAQSYSFAVRAANPGTQLSSEATVDVRVLGVNEYMPVFTERVYSFEVSESEDIDYVIGYVEARDADDGADGQVRYFLIGDSNLRGFAIDVTTGAISVQRPIDREQTEELTLQVLAKNLQPVREGVDTCTVRVVIGDANDPPVFHPAHYERSVAEDEQVGHVVVTVSAVDNDLNDDFRRFRFALAAGNDGSAFDIDPDSGEITVNRALDRETQAQYMLTVEAQDSGTPPRTGSASVTIHVTDVNDNAPVFSPSIPVGHLLEGEAPQSAIAIILTSVTSDADVSPNQGPYRYRLLDHLQDFVIGESTGFVQALRTLDREEVGVYDISVSIEDNGSPALSSVQTLRVQVDDVNDNPSQAGRTLQVTVFAREGRVPNTSVANVHPRDVDLVGDYRCQPLASASTSFRVTSECLLVVNTDRLLATTSLSLTGNDGVHGDVTYAARVTFEQFDDATVDNSVVLRLGDVTMSEFLATKRAQLQASLRQVLDAQVVTLFNVVLQDEQVLDVFVAAQEASSSYMRKSSIVQVLTAQRSRIEQEVGVTLTSVNFNPCQTSPCLNGGECSFSVQTNDSFTFYESGDIVLSSPTMQQQFECACTEDFTGDRCEIARVLCPSNFCLNDGVCVLVEGVAVCECGSRYTGEQCETPLQQCQPNPCLFGATCFVEGLGYRCECTPGYSGRNCDLRPRSFRGASFLAYDIATPQDQERNSVELKFATTQSDALLLYFPDLVKPNEFLALEVIGGRLRWSFGLGEQSEVVRVSVDKRVDTGAWFDVQATRDQRVRSKNLRTNFRLTSFTEHYFSCVYSLALYVYAPAMLTQRSATSAQAMTLCVSRVTRVAVSGSSYHYVTRSNHRD